MNTAIPPSSSELTPLLTAILNMTDFHHEHEKFYSVSPREQAVVLQRHSRVLHALADRWMTTAPSHPHVVSPYEGAADLNASAALQLDGVLFMEGGGEPGEISHLKRDLRVFAGDAAAAGEWLANAMQSSWDVATVLLDIEDLADLLGERHRIIANNWQGAAIMSLIARILVRAAEILDHVDFDPAALRADLAGRHVAARRLYSAAEMIDHAADLLSEFAGLVHDNERRWRVFRSRVQQVVAALEPSAIADDLDRPLAPLTVSRVMPCELRVSRTPALALIGALHGRGRARRVRQLFEAVVDCADVVDRRRDNDLDHGLRDDDHNEHPECNRRSGRLLHRRHRH